MKTKFVSVISAALSILAASATGAFAQDTYSITDLGSFNIGYALAINSSGQIAMNPSGSLALGNPLGTAINDSGQTALGDFLYTSGIPTALGYLPGGDTTGASGINNSGQVVGVANTGRGTPYQAFLYSGGTMTDLGQGGAIAINDSGQVVGYTAVNRDLPNHAFLYSSGTMTDLGTLGGGVSYATAINNIGQVVGLSDTAGDVADHAFLYTGGTMIDLGTLPGTSISEAHGINDNGQIVGYTETPTGSGGFLPYHAFIDSDGIMTDLNSLIPANSDWDLINAEGINNSGQILGFGTNPSGQTDAFLLTPTPEPSTVALSVAGAAVLFTFWRIKHRVTIL
jgi:probable HAF family extracellular repeat protein